MPPPLPPDLALVPPAAPAEQSDAPFWQTTPLARMTAVEWESLCDGCGRCCLVKLEDEDSGEIAYTDVICRLFETHSCRCSDYPNRQEHVSDCVRLTPEAVAELSWLPPTCAYRLLDEGKTLPWWHPLVSGSAETVHDAGISVRGKVAGGEQMFGLFELVDHLVSWPLRWPKGSRGARKPSAGMRTR
ncbi:YcgN family cysteine cluster protein [Xanthobacter sp. DSM 24535]|uniref:YcgN family cysteine cluster protein n=1 Tax=Roseixanthobacter psychrophilus TaxID=3119917 RepID=UPI003728BFAD